MGRSPLGPPTPKLSHLQAEPAHLPQHPILGGLHPSCSRPLWCQGSKNQTQMSSNHPLRRRGARRPQDRDGWNEFQSQGETTGLQPQPRLLGLCNFCPRFPRSGGSRSAGSRSQPSALGFWKDGSVWEAGATGQGRERRGRGHARGALGAPRSGLLSKTTALNPKPNPRGASRHLSCTSAFPAGSLASFESELTFHPLHRVCLLCRRAHGGETHQLPGGSQDIEINLLGSLMTATAAGIANL